MPPPAVRCGWTILALALVLAALRRAGGARAGLSGAHGENRGAVPRRRHRRCRAAHHRRLAVAQMGPVGDRRGSHRRRRQYRRRIRRQIRSRRLHAVGCRRRRLWSSIKISIRISISIRRKFVPIVVIGRVPNALVVNPDKIAANTVKDFIAYAAGQCRQGHRRHAGQRHHLAPDVRTVSDDGAREIAERALSRLGAGAQRSRRRQRRLHVRQSRRLDAARQSRQAETDRGRRAQSAWRACPTCRPSPRRCPGFDAAAWYAIVAPPGTPAAIVDKVNAGVNEALHDPDIRKRLADLSAEPVGGTPQATAAYFREETERWKNVITSAHVTLD